MRPIDPDGAFVTSNLIFGQQAMRALINNFIRSDSGATAIEYAFIASFIAMACIAGLTIAGTNLNVKFALVSNGLN
jgi:pilus assembly protein Flp/PilA